MAEGKKNSKKVPFKNYVIITILFVFGVGITLYLCRWYSVYDEYQKQTPVIRGYLQEITNNDLEHYLMENPSVVIYICTANAEECRSYEKDFKKVIQKEEINDYLVYLNLTNEDQESFVNNFNNLYPFKTKLTTNYPAFVVFEDGKIKAILQGKEGETLKVGKTKQFLEINERVE